MTRLHEVGHYFGMREARLAEFQLLEPDEQEELGQEKTPAGSPAGVEGC